jgi:hypothetical protein
MTWPCCQCLHHPSAFEHTSSTACRTVLLLPQKLPAIEFSQGVDVLLYRSRAGPGRSWHRDLALLVLLTWRLTGLAPAEAIGAQELLQSHHTNTMNDADQLQHRSCSTTGSIRPRPSLAALAALPAHGNGPSVKMHPHLAAPCTAIISATQPLLHAAEREACCR